MYICTCHQQNICDAVDVNSFERVVNISVHLSKLVLSIIGFLEWLTGPDGGRIDGQHSNMFDKSKTSPVTQHGAHRLVAN